MKEEKVKTVSPFPPSPGVQWHRSSPSHCSSRKGCTPSPLVGATAGPACSPPSRQPPEPHRGARHGPLDHAPGQAAPGGHGARLPRDIQHWPAAVSEAVRVLVHSEWAAPQRVSKLTSRSSEAHALLNSLAFGGHYSVEGSSTKGANARADVASSCLAYL